MFLAQSKIQSQSFLFLKTYKLIFRFSKIDEYSFEKQKILISKNDKRNNTYDKRTVFAFIKKHTHLTLQHKSVLLTQQIKYLLKTNKAINCQPTL